MNPFKKVLYLAMANTVIRRYKTIDGFLAPFEAAALYRVAQLLPPDGIVVEIGSWKGKSTYCITRGLRGRIYAIDPFDASGEGNSATIYNAARGAAPLLEQFKHNMSSAAALDKVTILQGYSQQFVDAVPNMHFLFIDGDHSIEGCRFDFEHYGPKVLPGGYIAFHDYYPGRNDLGPTWVIDNLVKPSGKFRQVELAASLWIGQRI
jgi:hypothetical protein